MQPNNEDRGAGGPAQPTFSPDDAQMGATNNETLEPTLAAPRLTTQNPAPPHYQSPPGQAFGAFGGGEFPFSYMTMQPPSGFYSPSEGHFQAAPGIGECERQLPHDVQSDAKLEAIRTKNREAQQRFRDRQRAKRQEAEDSYAELEAERDRLIAMNESLSKQNFVMEKVLAVRDSLLSAFQHTAQHSMLTMTTGGGAGIIASPITDRDLVMQDMRGLAAAIDNLPPQTELDNVLAETAAAHTAATTLRPSALTTDNNNNNTLSANSSGESQEVLGAAVPSLLLSASGKLELSGAIDGAALQKEECIPPASDPEMAATIAAMAAPKDLFDYWKLWTVDLASAWEAAEANGFGDGHVKAIHDSIAVMASMWWHAAQLKPDFLVHLMASALPRDSAQQQLWAEIAAKLLPQLKDEDLTILRKAWHKYTKNLAKAAVGVQHWMQRLQVTEPPSGHSLHTSAAASLDLVEIAKHIAAAVQEEYTATMTFIGDQAPVTTADQKAYINYASLPYMPDVVAIMYQVLKLSQLQSGTVIVEQPAARALEPRSA